MTCHNKIAVVGLGFVGLPLAVLFAKKGFKVYGFDIDPKKIELINYGVSYITDVSDKDILTLTKQQKFNAYLPSSKLKEVNYIIVTVPTPFDEEKMEPDLKAVIKASEFIAQNLMPKQTIIFESSTYPGTLEELVLPILSTSNLKVGQDFFLGYSPERIDPGNSSFAIEQIPKVVSGFTSNCKQGILELYANVFQRVIPVSSPKVAEMTKLFENTQRLVNISLVNEIHMICEKMGINFREVIDAASTKPFGFTPYYPGPGIGGHCIPVDPLYFQWKASKYGLASELIHTAYKINKEMPLEISNLIISEISKQKSTPKSVLLLGITYKKDVADIRESPAISIFNNLLKNAVDVKYHDPFIPSVNIMNKTYYSQQLNPETISAASMIVVLTDHTSIYWKSVLEHANSIIDTRGVFLKSLDKGES